MHVQINDTMCWSPHELRPPLQHENSYRLHSDASGCCCRMDRDGTSESLQAVQSTEVILKHVRARYEKHRAGLPLTRTRRPHADNTHRPCVSLVNNEAGRVQQRRQQHASIGKGHTRKDRMSPCAYSVSLSPSSTCTTSEGDGCLTCHLRPRRSRWF